jgi:hypothetical protein
MILHKKTNHLCLLILAWPREGWLKYAMTLWHMVLRYMISTFSWPYRYRLEITFFTLHR